MAIRIIQVEEGKLDDQIKRLNEAAKQIRSITDANKIDNIDDLYTLRNARMKVNQVKSRMGEWKKATTVPLDIPTMPDKEASTDEKKETVDTDEDGENKGGE